MPHASLAVTCYKCVIDCSFGQYRTQYTALHNSVAIATLKNDTLIAIRMCMSMFLFFLHKFEVLFGLFYQNTTNVLLQIILATQMPRVPTAMDRMYAIVMTGLLGMDRLAKVSVINISVMVLCGNVIIAISRYLYSTMMSASETKRFWADFIQLDSIEIMLCCQGYI